MFIAERTSLWLYEKYKTVSHIFVVFPFITETCTPYVSGCCKDYILHGIQNHTHLNQDYYHHQSRSWVIFRYTPASTAY
jgi:hypothetical protein